MTKEKIMEAINHEMDNVDWLMENPDKAAEIGVEDDDEDEQE